jgi:hypothetical protein
MGKKMTVLQLAKEPKSAIAAEEPLKDFRVFEYNHGDGGGYLRPADFDTLEEAQDYALKLKWPLWSRINDKDGKNYPVSPFKVRVGDQKAEANA